MAAATSRRQSKRPSRRDRSQRSTWGLRRRSEHPEDVAIRGNPTSLPVTGFAKRVVSMYLPLSGETPLRLAHSSVHPMRFLLSLALLASLSVGACGGGTPSSATPATGPQAPINPPDGGSGGQIPPKGNGGGSGGGSGSGSGSGSGAPSGGQGPGGGGQPVPEPGTFVLVGSGMAALAMLRRRRKSGEAPA